MRAIAAASCCVLLTACNVGIDTTRPVTPELVRKIEAKSRAAAQSPEDLKVKVELADLYREAGRYFEAADHYLGATQIDPKSPAAHYGLALSYNAVGYYTRAFQSMRDCLGADPDHPDCLFLTGTMLRSDGSQSALEQSRFAFERLLSVAPNDPRAASVRQSLQQLSAQLKPKADAPAAPASRPAGDAPAADAPSGGLALPDHDNVEGADVGALNPFGASIGKAMAAVRADDPTAAESALREALKIRPGDPGATAMLAETLYRQEKVEEAQKTATAAYEANREHAHARYVYGLVHLKSGKDIGPALEAWRALLRDDPAYAEKTGVKATLEKVGQLK